jgi:glutamate carboxypeptidase
MQGINEAELLEGILSWTRIGSSTFNVAGVNRMMDLAGEDSARLGLKLERIPGSSYGDVLLARLPDAEGATTGGILVLGHLDTIQCGETVIDDVPVRIEGDRVYGTGVYDMKGGMRMALYGLEVLLRSGSRPALPITFMFIPDEEIGSPTTRSLIEAEARRQKYVLVPEPSHDGRLVSGRHAFLRYTVTTKGKPAHAGVDNRNGVSAVRAMARIVEKIEGLNDLESGETFSVGVIGGGLFVNVIPTICRAQVLCVAPTEASFDRIRKTMASLAGDFADGTSVEIEPGPVRPLFRATPASLALFEEAAKIGKTIGISLSHAQFGGGSDGNFTGALGIPTLDGLGVDGAALHTPGEYMSTGTLVQRCHILSELMRTLK